MRTKVKLLSAFFLIVYSMAYAQNGITVTNGLAIGDSGSISYSVSPFELVEVTGTGGDIFQGMQIPMEVIVISGLEEQWIDLNINSFPNPVTDVLNLEVDNPGSAALYYRLFAPDSKILKEKSLQKNLTQIHMSEFAPATYILQVASKNKTLKSFKIIKNK